MVGEESREANAPDINYSSYFECVLQEEAHIRDKVFKVTIPSLFPEVDNKFTPTDNTDNNDKSARIANKNNSHIDDSYSSTTIIEAKNHTDYHYQLKGDSFNSRMEATVDTTEPGSCPAGSPHTHAIKQPISLLNYVYENLNNVIVPKGTKAYGFFINGAQTTDSFVITRIEGAVPLQPDDSVRYVK